MIYRDVEEGNIKQEFKTKLILDLSDIKEQRIPLRDDQLYFLVVLLHCSMCNNNNNNNNNNNIYIYIYKY